MTVVETVRSVRHKSSILIYVFVAKDHSMLQVVMDTGVGPV